MTHETTKTPEEYERFVSEVRAAADMNCDAGEMVRRLCVLMVRANLDEHADMECASDAEYEDQQEAMLRLWHIAVAMRPKENQE